MKTSVPAVVFEDNHLLVVDKPAGMLTQPTDQELRSLENWAKEWIKIKYSKPGNVYLHAVHRLDRPVSGLVVFAKTSKALSRLNESMRAKSCRKVYHATVEGIVKNASGCLDQFLTHDDHCARVFDKEVVGSSRAVLYYKVLEKKERTTLLEIVLETGRYHQIRAQLAAMGYPIVGDVKYGANGGGDMIALRHVSLSLPHPVSKELLQLTAP